MKKLNYLLEDIEIIEQNIAENQTEVNGITDDSREVADGFIYIAVKGSISDGNKFIDGLKNKNLALIVTDDKDTFFKYKSDLDIILVKNTRLTLSQLLNKFYDFPAKDFKVIGVTGTNGKTTVSTLIYQALRKIDKNVALIGTNGIWLNDEKTEATHTTPSVKDLIRLFIKLKSLNFEYIVMEVSSHSLDQYRVEFINFDVAIFTNLSRDHLDYHLSMENYAKAKKMLFDSLSNKSLAIINSDDLWGDFMVLNCAGKVQKLSKIKKNINYHYINIIDSSSIGNKFEIINGEDILKIESRLLSDFNIMNLSFVALSLQFLGVNQIPELLADLNGPEGRMEKVSLINGAIAVIDYAHTPDALEKCLISLNQFKENKLICVFGCGGDRDKGKRPIMGEIACRIANYIYITSDNPRTENPEDIINDITGSLKENYEVVVDRKQAIEKAILNSQKGDIILIAGKGHEKYQVIGKEKIYFDDFEEIKKSNEKLNL